MTLAGTVEHPRATTVLVLGVVGLLCCGLCGPIAWVLGRRTLNEIERSGGAYGGSSQVRIGYVLGIITTVFMVCAVLLWLLLILDSLH
ncbi:DUF4190 domain-containing protein [Skermania piniformis]|uniref:DUF4190 domain-containing protein n=1 Tax=Skermania pinensis TaxID=39122 RepID=UPI001FE8899D|nr:DUF4190 domain-containing protein [Skermania piniformis]